MRLRVTNKAALNGWAALCERCPASQVGMDSSSSLGTVGTRALAPRRFARQNARRSTPCGAQLSPMFPNLSGQGRDQLSEQHVPVPAAVLLTSLTLAAALKHGRAPACLSPVTRVVIAPWWEG